ncbi:protein of unknown function [Methylorubrum extorquens]|uniref:SLC26A/SulP transporter domain-containing protein n=1 Tax=Methylorubrum extorquens TaxID=408 RepID=A0A2N9AMX9_METEX|nr:protein of unknown function [Methylorubrum extorquens]
MPNGAATAHLYKPKLVTVLAEGYGVAVLRRDVMAGLTVAIVALPLSMAIAVASGVSPDRGALRRHRRRLRRLRSRRQPLPDRRAGGSLHRPRLGHCCPFRRRRHPPRRAALRSAADSRRRVSAGLANPAYPARGHRRLHGGHRLYDPGQSVEGIRRPQTGRR